MSVALKIKDEASDGKLVSVSILQFPAEKITVKELIEARVNAEVEKYNQSTRVRFMGLIQPKDSEKDLNGYKVKKNRAVDVEIQRSTALAAFENNGFFLLVNDKQLTELDNEIIITPNTSVSFLKLIPLVGG